MLFEARGKTELSSAFGLMKALAGSGNYRVSFCQVFSSHERAENRPRLFLHFINPRNKCTTRRQMWGKKGNKQLV